MSEREEVKREFTTDVLPLSQDGSVVRRVVNIDAIADEIVRLRSQLREREQEVFAARVDKDFAERERDEARREVERMREVVEAARDYEQSHGKWYDYVKSRREKYHDETGGLLIRRVRTFDAAEAP